MYQALNSTEISTGEPTTNSMLTKVKDNFDNHEERLLAAETGSSTVYTPIVFGVYGRASDIPTASRTGYIKSTLNFNITVTGIRIIVDKAGVSGSHEIDVLFSRSGASYASLLSTKPSVSYTAGNDAISTNTVLDVNNVDLMAGDIIRMDLTSVQSMGSNFIIRIDYNKA